MDEAIVLAGGLGTRLRSVVADVPKPMAPVAGRPFLDYILHYLERQGVNRVVLAVGYKWEIIRDHYDANKDIKLDLVYSVETEPLGTGGAIFKAAAEVKGDSFFIINGDTSFPVSLKALKAAGEKRSADLAIALKKIKHSGRYGSVEHHDDGRIIAFKEKNPESAGPAEINGGIYWMKKDLVNRFRFPEKFSFETDLMKGQLEKMKAFCKPFNRAFIDIGIPEDFYRAQKLFKNVIS